MRPRRTKAFYRLLAPFGRRVPWESTHPCWCRHQPVSTELRRLGLGSRSLRSARPLGVESHGARPTPVRRDAPRPFTGFHSLRSGAVASSRPSGLESHGDRPTPVGAGTNQSPPNSGDWALVPVRFAPALARRLASHPPRVHALQLAPGSGPPGAMPFEFRSTMPTLDW